jgi:hypothetical protein
VSCATGEGIEDFKRALFRLCPPAEAPLVARDGDLVDYLVYRPKPRKRRTFRILRTDRGYRVAGRPPPRDELEEALRAAGVRKGDAVEIGDETVELA